MKTTGENAYITKNNLVLTNFMKGYCSTSLSLDMEKARPHTKVKKHRISAHLMSPLADTTLPSNIRNFGTSRGGENISVLLQFARYSDTNLVRICAQKMANKVKEPPGSELPDSPSENTISPFKK